MLTLTFAGITLATGLPQGTVLSGDLTVDGVHKVQVEELIGAASPIFFDRITRSKTVSFTVERQNGAIARRMWQQLIGVDSLPGVGTLVLTLTIGPVTYTFTTPGAKPSQSSLARITADTTTYQFQTGAWIYRVTGLDDPDPTIPSIGGRHATEMPDRSYGGRGPLSLITRTLGGRAA